MANNKETTELDMSRPMTMMLMMMLMVVMVSVVSSTTPTPPAGKVYGCTDPNANNYNPIANVDDGSCTYGTGCNTTDMSLQYVCPYPYSSPDGCRFATLAQLNAHIALVHPGMPEAIDIGWS